MSRLFLILILVMSNMSLASGQNLVPNPGFEEKLYCPVTHSYFIAVKYWSSISYTPDYFNACAQNIVGVPENDFGYQAAHSGIAYAGAYCYSSAGNYREIIGVRLIEDLIVGVKYFLSAYISKADFHCWSSDHFGFKFSTVEYNHLSNPAPIDNYAHFYSTSIITDSIKWVKISGSFIADSAYRYGMLGNFFDLLNTSYVVSGNPFDCGYASYYYIDDVCVSTDSLSCEIETGLADLNQTGFTIFPNPFSDRTSLNTSEELKDATFTVYNRLGQIVKEIKDIRGNSVVFTRENLFCGIYIGRLTQNNKVLANIKLVITD